MSKDDCDGFETELTEKMLRLPLLSSDKGLDPRYILRCERYLSEQKIATTTAVRKIMPSVQNAIASFDCETQRTSGPR